MDANVREVLIAALPIIGGVLVGILVAKITADRSRQLEREKWKRELYASFLHATNEVRDAFHLMAQGTEPEPDWAEHLDRGHRLFLEIQMIAPSMVPSASAIWDAVTALVATVKMVTAPTGVVLTIDAPRRDHADERYRLAMRAFIAAASKELG